MTPQDRSGDAAAIVLDCSTADRTGEPGEGIEGLPTLVIDHHAAGDPFGDERLIVPTVPATALLVQGLIELLGGPPTREEADLLLFAICTDTGFFRHLRKDTGYVFRAVARLVDAGASTEAAYSSMFGARPFERRVMLGRMLARTERLYGGLLLYTAKYASDRAEIGEAGRGDDDLYSLLQTVDGARGAAGRARGESGRVLGEHAVDHRRRRRLVRARAGRRRSSAGGRMLLPRHRRAGKACRAGGAGSQD